MLLCLDIGNTHIYGGIFQENKLSFQFRYPSKTTCTSDEIGLFLKAYLQEIGLDPKAIKKVALGSVVPSLDYSVRSAFIKYFSLEPFVLQAGIKTGLQIKCKTPSEVGADRIATAIAAFHQFPKQNIIIIDLGTATTVEIVTEKGALYAGVIMPGLQMQMRALHEYTANLPPVRIIKTKQVVGQCTTTNIQSGLYYGQVGAIKEIVKNIKQTMFPKNSCIVIGTGGFSQLFEEENIFDTILADLVLHGLRIAYYKNQL